MGVARTLSLQIILLEAHTLARVEAPGPVGERVRSPADYPITVRFSPYQPRCRGLGGTDEPSGSPSIQVCRPSIADPLWLGGVGGLAKEHISVVYPFTWAVLLFDPYARGCLPRRPVAVLRYEQTREKMTVLVAYSHTAPDPHRKTRPVPAR